MSVMRHWDVYACPGECVGRSGLWNVAPKDMTCPNCGGTVEALRVYQQPQGAVALIEQARYCVTYALNCPAHPWHGSDEARKWLIEAARLGQ